LKIRGFVKVSTLVVVLALSLGACAPESATTARGEPKGSLDLSRIVILENSVPTLELGDDGTVLNLLSTRPEPIIQHRCGVQVLQARFVRSDGQPEVLITPVNYVLDIALDDESIAYFDRWEEFAGNLQGRRVGNTQIHISLVQLANSSVILGPFHVPVEVQSVDREPC
jgi:hypothetical protein